MVFFSKWCSHSNFCPRRRSLNCHSTDLSRCSLWHEVPTFLLPHISLLLLLPRNWSLFNNYLYFLIISFLRKWVKGLEVQQATRMRPGFKGQHWKTGSSTSPHYSLPSNEMWGTPGEKTASYSSGKRPQVKQQHLCLSNQQSCSGGRRRKKVERQERRKEKRKEGEGEQAL